MNDSTVTTTVEFGKKANDYQTEAFSYTTIVYIDEISLTHALPYYSGTYRIVDYSDEKKMDTYRKVNKMLGGK